MLRLDSMTPRVSLSPRTRTGQAIRLILRPWLLKRPRARLPLGAILVRQKQPLTSCYFRKNIPNIKSNQHRNQHIGI